MFVRHYLTNFHKSMSHYRTIHILPNEEYPTYRIGIFRGRIALILGYPGGDGSRNKYEIIIEAHSMDIISNYMQ